VRRAARSECRPRFLVRCRKLQQQQRPLPT